MFHLRLLFVAFVASTALCQHTAQVARNIKMAELINDEMKIVQNKKINRQKINKLLRFIFHDCIGDDGCDGCIDLNNKEDNFGLTEIFGELDKVYGNHFGPQEFNISRADFHVLAAFVAADIGSGGRRGHLSSSSRGANLVMEFKEGRKDCCLSPKEDDPNERFPSSSFNKEQMLVWFEKEMGFNADEMTAIMGAHTIGKVRAFEDAGQHSKWVNNNQNLNNCIIKRYNRGYTQIEGPNNTFHWENKRNNEIMLHCDIAMSYEFQLDTEKKANCLACRNPKCYNGDGSLAAQTNRRMQNKCGNCCPRWNVEKIEEFRDNEKWVLGFRDAMLKMSVREQFDDAQSTRQCEQPAQK